MKTRMKPTTRYTNVTPNGAQAGDIFTHRNMADFRGCTGDRVARVLIVEIDNRNGVPTKLDRAIAETFMSGESVESMTMLYGLDTNDIEAAIRRATVGR